LILTLGEQHFVNSLNFYVDTGEATLGQNFYVTIGGLHEKHAVQRGIWAPTQHLL
jgi:hypothetical protein